MKGGVRMTDIINNSEPVSPVVPNPEPATVSSVQNSEPVSTGENISLSGKYSILAAEFRTLGQKQIFVMVQRDQAFKFIHPQNPGAPPVR